jgi:hypothetical protein
MQGLNGMVGLRNGSVLYYGLPKRLGRLDLQWLTITFYFTGSLHYRAFLERHSYNLNDQPQQSMVFQLY